MIANKILAIGFSTAILWLIILVLFGSSITNISMLGWIILALGVITVFGIYKYLIPSFDTASRRKVMVWRFVYGLFLAGIAVDTINIIRMLGIWPEELSLRISEWSHIILLLIPILTLLIAWFYGRRKEKIE